MGFTVNNSFGKFSAETHMPLPSFSAESLMSLPTKQFGAATLDGDSLTNYEDSHWSKFTLAPTSTSNVDGMIKTRSDKGFEFKNDADSGKTLSIKLHNAAKTLSQVFTLAPGDRILRDGGYSTVVTIPAGGTEEVDGVITTIPWMTGWRPTDEEKAKKFSNTGSRHDYFVEVLPAVDLVDPSGGTGGTGGNGTGDTDEEEEVVADADADEDDGPNYLLYGGGLALLVVGGIMASKMLKK